MSQFLHKIPKNLKNHIAKKHSQAIARVVHDCEIFKNFHSFHILRDHRPKEHGAQTGSGAQNVDDTQLMGDFDDKNLKDK